MEFRYCKESDKHVLAVVHQTKDDTLVNYYTFEIKDNAAFINFRKATLKQVNGHEFLEESKVISRTYKTFKMFLGVKSQSAVASQLNQTLCKSLHGK